MKHDHSRSRPEGPLDYIKRRLDAVEGLEELGGRLNVAAFCFARTGAGAGIKTVRMNDPEREAKGEGLRREGYTLVAALTLAEDGKAIHFLDIGGRRRWKGLGRQMHAVHRKLEAELGIARRKAKRQAEAAA